MQFKSECNIILSSQSVGLSVGMPINYYKNNNYIFKRNLNPLKSIKEK